MKLSPEQFVKASACSTPQELVDAAVKAGINCSIEQAEVFLRSNEMVELSENDIEDVSGGCGSPAYTADGYLIADTDECPTCGVYNWELQEHQGTAIYRICNACGQKWVSSDDGAQR